MKNELLNLIAALTRQLLPACGNAQLAEQEAWWMLEAITKKHKAALLLEPTRALTPHEHAMLESWVTQRALHHKPLQYILGSVPFCNIEIIVRPPTLIPRPETEEWTAWLIKLLRTTVDDAPLRILDLCCGSGCIALALAKALPRCDIIGLDISPKAIALCIENQRNNEILTVEFLLSDLYEAIQGQEGTFDLIVSNPPYIAHDEWLSLSQDVRLWEDPAALKAADEGLAVSKRIIAHAKDFLKSDSRLARHHLPQIVLEMDIRQGGELRVLLEQAGFGNVEVHQDIEGKDRWISALARKALAPELSSSPR